MALKTYKPYTKSTRATVLVNKSQLWKGGSYKPLTKGQKSSGGRNNYGRITSRHRGGGVKHKYRIIDFLRNKKIQISKIEYCPHHKHGIIKRFAKICKCRKPNNLMIKKIFKKWKIEKKTSFMIGDRLTDKLCAKKSKLYFEYAKPNFFSQIKLIIKNI